MEVRRRIKGKKQGIGLISEADREKGAKALSKKETEGCSIDL
jgi:hypothetical protein